MNEADAVVEKDRDEELVRKFLAGDDRAFDTLFSRYRHQMFALAYRICGSRADAEDLCQEIFLLAFRKLHTFKGHSLFSTWLYRLGVNRCKDHLRKKKRTRDVPPLENMVGEGGEPLGAITPATNDPDQPQARVLATEAQEIVGAAIAELPKKLRVPLVLHDVQGFHYREIAEILRIPVGTVKSRIFRGRMKLGEELKPYQELWTD